MSLSIDNLASLAPRTITAELFFLEPMAARPRTYTFEPPAGAPRSNATYVPHHVTIRDAPRVEHVQP